VGIILRGEPRLDDKRLFLNSDHLDSSPIWKRIFPSGSSFILP
jgi:hypothetical protein